jgi:hypothetical protein
MFSRCRVPTPHIKNPLACKLTAGVGVQSIYSLVRREVLALIFQLCPVVAALAVILLGRAVVTDEMKERELPTMQWSYRVIAGPPVVVRTSPSWDAFVLGTVEPGSLVPAREDSTYIHADGETTHFRHVGGANWDGWVLAVQLTQAHWAPLERPAFQWTYGAWPAICRESPISCLGP